MNKPRLLLHTCCATCGCWIPELLSKDYDLDIFYFNPNIHPESEYLKRVQEAKKAADILGFKLIQAEYNPQEWFKSVKGMGIEKECGKRCTVCFDIRLEETAKYAIKHGYDIFCTALTIGRTKKAEVINPIGEAVAKKHGIEFLSRNFKKNGGLDISVEKSKEYGLERQDYCGCAFSLRDSIRKKLKRLTAD